MTDLPGGDLENSSRAIVGGPEGEARIRRLQDATKAYALAWQAPTWPGALAGAAILVLAALAQLDSTRRASALLLTYTPLAWALAQRLAEWRWSPPLGDVQLSVLEGGRKGWWRWPASALLVLINVVAPVVQRDGVHLAAVSIGTLWLLWAGKPLRGGGGAIAMMGVCVARPSGAEIFKGFHLSYQLAVAVMLLAEAGLARGMRRQAARELARATEAVGNP